MEGDYEKNYHAIHNFIGVELSDKPSFFYRKNKSKNARD